MARFSIALFAVVAAVLSAPPAVAQLGGIFGNEPPPRPPANVPNRSDAPPAQAMPPGAPPNPERPRSRVQSQSLPPPLGATPAPLAPQPQTPSVQTPPPSDETVLEPPTPKIANPTAVFSGLDKITGRIFTFDVAIGETVRFGALEVTPRICYTRPPTELPHTDGFVEVDELTLQGELRRIFTGWMFAASPGLSAVEHPIYDVWLVDCKGGALPALTVDTPPNETAPPQPAATRPQQQRPPARPPAPPPSR
jgi:hypothetical protein